LGSQVFLHLLTFQGYFGAAAGKGKQVAKNELEKLDLKNMTCREAVYKAAKMYVAPIAVFWM